MFRKFTRLHIPGMLNQAGATRLYEHLARELEWSLAVLGDNGAFEVPPDKRREAPQRDRESAAYAYARAKKGFQFIYEYRNTANNTDERARDPSLLARFADFLNSPEVIGFMRRLTGFEDIAYANAMATRYQPGHFLTAHDDQTDHSRNRRVAFVYNLTPRWEPDWGGLLQFIDSDGHISEAYTPRFNAFNLFKVPQMHSVSFVAPYARAARYSITGWFWAAA